jgi:hypothetical protein
MKLIGKYNFAKAQNPQSGGSTKVKLGMATVGLHATKKIKLCQIKLERKRNEEYKLYKEFCDCNGNRGYINSACNRAG